jgi:hypothetical protein
VLFQVVRHERASIKADIWSYGILIWELVTGYDIVEYQPLAISRQMGTSNGKVMSLPAKSPPVAKTIFTACTQVGTWTFLCHDAHPLGWALADLGCI